VLASSVKISKTAGRIIKDIMSGGDLKIVDKSTDGGPADPQTLADRSAQWLIVNSLQKKFGGLVIIGEEEKTSAVPELELGESADVLHIDDQCPEHLRHIRQEDLVVWVDPLDGTSEFVEAAKNKSPLLQQVTVLIGITYKGSALAGVIHQPYHDPERSIGRTIWGIKGVGAFGIGLPRENFVERIGVTSRSHSTSTNEGALSALISKNYLTSVENMGGAGYKVLKVIEGAAAYVFAGSGTKKWDTAATEAILAAMGGCLTDASGRQLHYGKDVQHMNTGGIIATAPWLLHHEFIKAIPDEVKSQLPENHKC